MTTLIVFKDGIEVHRFSMATHYISWVAQELVNIGYEVKLGPT